ncbi:protein of unknown function [Cupriavidus taiwanensis]|nr:protein of unknown function [Cupriavidus taiwanensis]
MCHKGLRVAPRSRRGPGRRAGGIPAGLRCWVETRRWQAIPKGAANALDRATCPHAPD